MACFIQAHTGDTSIPSKRRFQMLFHTMKESVHLCDLFLNLWNGNINDLIQSFRFPGTYCIFQIPATVASSVHTFQPRCNSHEFSPWIHPMDSFLGFALRLDEGFSCLLQKVIKQSVSLSVRSTCFVCEQSDSPCPLQMCAPS